MLTEILKDIETENKGTSLQNEWVKWYDGLPDESIQKMRKLKTFKEYLHEDLKHHEELRAFLQVAIDEYAKDDDKEVFLEILQTVIDFTKIP